MIDEIKIFLKAGDGGKGIVAWRREAHVENGGPNGGDGGKGGDIYFIGDHNLSSLLDLSNKKNIIAQNGENGGGDNLSGKNGQDIYINVPLGTVLYNNKNEILAEIVYDKQKLLVCHGGIGGKGNTFFKSSINRVPTLHENGDIGEERDLILKLKTIADIGIIGLPNAGKSSLLSLITNAKSKVGNYQFTTLNPILGVYNYNNQKIIIADIPGLIDGASNGKGLGIKFLKHIERCKVLIHLISLDENDTNDIVNDYKTIKAELKKYSKELAKKPSIIVGNKIDCEYKKNYTILKEKIKKPILKISVKDNIGIDELFDNIFKKYGKFFKSDVITFEKTQEIKTILPSKYTFTYTKTDNGIWKIESNYLDYWSHKIPLDTKDNIIRFNQKIESTGVEKKILEEGGKIGDTMIISGQEFVIN